MERSGTLVNSSALHCSHGFAWFLISQKNVGGITKEELKEALFDLREEVSDDDVQQMFEDVGLSADEKLDVDRFVQYFGLGQSR